MLNVGKCSMGKNEKRKYAWNPKRKRYWLIMAKMKLIEINFQLFLQVESHILNSPPFFSQAYPWCKS